MNLSAILSAFISFEELTVIMLIAIVVFGPKRIPEIARGLGEGLRAMKKATDDIKREILNPVEDINPVKDIKDSIEKAKDDISKPVTDVTKDIEESIDDAVGPIKRS
ncbi:MAG: twin-arginine translocase TatA/TatE family subunit [Weeksellaceae bacterium]